MKNILRKIAIITFAATAIAGCAKSEDELNTRTPERQKQADRVHDMGESVDRSKSKGY